MFSNPGPHIKICQAMAVLLFSWILRALTNSLLLFLYLSRISLYYMKAYLYGFVLSRGSKFLGAPFMVKN